MKKIYIGIILLIVVIGVCFLLNQDYFTFEVHENNINNKEKENVFINEGVLIKKTNIYIKEDKYKVIGEIEKDVSLKFVKLVDNFLMIDGFDNKYYVKIDDVKSCDECYIEKDKRYLEYIVFNENVVTKDKTRFYDSNNNLLYVLNKSYEFPVIVKDGDKYGIEFNGELLYVMSSDVKEVITTSNTDRKNSSGVGVLNYHFFYDKDNKEEKNNCNQVICESTEQFQKELDYLKENNILTITTKELEWYIDGKVNLPKSVLITIDDGWMMGGGIDLLEKNKMYGCAFLITSWWDNIDFLNDYEYIEFNSHGDDLHDTGTCPGGQGGGIKCLPKERLLNDLKVSSEKLNGSKVLAYPFYEYNDYSIEVLKEAGYTMAFAGETKYNDNLVHVGSNKYKLPRFVMVNYTTINDLDNYFSNIK